MEENKYGIDPALITEFVDESVDMLNGATNYFIVLETDPGDRNAIDAVFRAFHTIKGNSSFFSMMKVKGLAHAMEDVMELVRNSTIILSKPIVTLLIRGCDELKSMMHRVRDGQGEISDEAVYNELLAHILAQVEEGKRKDADSIWRLIVTDLADLKARCAAGDKSAEALAGRLEEHIASVAPGIVHKARAKAVSDKEVKSSARKESTHTAKTMRIAESSVDHFFDLVGELVIISEMYDHLHKRFVEGVTLEKALIDLKKNNESFSDVSLKLQKSVMDVRKVPFETLFQRAPRIMREAAASTDKKARLMTRGEQILIDKSLIETLDAPFMHIIRNAIDHGIEAPEERRRRGKDAEGVVTVEAWESGDTVIIAIEDDGNGVDKSAVTRVALDRGLIPAEKAAAVNEDDLYQCIFTPGFSTAAKVSDVSGRGVGLDVVKKNVEAIGGKVTLRTVPLKGARFELHLPSTVTAKIINGFLVAADGARYIFPLTSVVDSFEIDPAYVTVLPGNNERILHHGKTYPLLRLSTLLKAGAYTEEIPAQIGVSVMAGTSIIVVRVCEALGIQQAVVKKIDGLQGVSESIAGGAILGDERVAIVLNPERLLG